MSIVKNKDKRSGITYVYESESYWDKEKQQPRSHRRLIGKLDEKTGKIVPTDGRGRNRKDQKNKTTADTTLSPASDKGSLSGEKDLKIRKLEEEIAVLKKEKALVMQQLNQMLGQLSGEKQQ